MVVMEILLPWQQDRLLTFQLFRGIETPVLGYRDTSWLKIIISRNGYSGWGVRSGDEW